MTELDRIKQEVVGFTDRPGQKVDAGIFDLVVALRLKGFKTIISCEGHLEDKRWARFFPYVVLSYVEPFQSFEGAELKKCHQNNLKMQSKLIDLLEDFYSKHYQTPNKHRLICNTYVEFGTKLMPQL